ncbi:glycoside hydrolase family 16 protein [Thermothelomyces heterothallicus CBS 202.75]|uniref:glycoside hydrolase family 16 protein n=1 Tax=Thermothelomyces heterothallicus CBS 202.75 TaxID=1149848 RepID=UPI0037434920
MSQPLPLPPPRRRPPLADLLATNVAPLFFHLHLHLHLHHFLVLLLVIIVIGYAPRTARADCECGYLAAVHGSAGGDRRALFTDLLETDFARLAAGARDDDDDDDDDDDAGPDASPIEGWARQAFNLTRERARGEYGELFAVENVGFVAAAGGKKGDAGLRLMVRAEIVDGMVPVAELDTQRLDLMWGTFRAMMKVSSVKGTCAAFFWYFNDTQEIDMEFLSKDFNASNGSYPVNLVLQSREAAAAGHDASGTGGHFVRALLPFDPAGDFHEYRIDYLPGRVTFYADGEPLADMEGPAVPSSPGHLILQHWSNGNRYWSGGPPAEDASLLVSYVKAYFNSSTAQRRRDWEARCRDPTAPGAVCEIPDVAPGNWSAAADWFFGDHANMTNNQTASGRSEEASSPSTEPSWPIIIICWLWLWLAAEFASAV